MDTLLLSLRNALGPIYNLVDIVSHLDENPEIKDIAIEEAQKILFDNKPLIKELLEKLEYKENPVIKKVEVLKHWLVTIKSFGDDHWFLIDDSPIEPVEIDPAEDYYLAPYHPVFYYNGSEVLFLCGITKITDNFIFNEDGKYPIHQCNKIIGSNNSRFGLPTFELPWNIKLQKVYEEKFGNNKNSALNSSLKKVFELGFKSAFEINKYDKHDLKRAFEEHYLGGKDFINERFEEFINEIEKEDKIYEVTKLLFEPYNKKYYIEQYQNITQ